MRIYPIGFKKCHGCKTVLPVAMFYKNRHAHDGLQTGCKQCSITRTLAMQISHPEQHNEYSSVCSQRFKEKHGISRGGIWGSKNKELKQTYNRTHYLIRSGELPIPMLCDDCNQKRKLQAHHQDYSRPDFISWLCRSCHCKRHGKTARVAI